MSRYIGLEDAVKVVQSTIFECINADTRKKLIEAIPSIDIEPKRGRWVETNYTDCGATVYMCSVCTHGISDMKVRKYCPNCGARMKGADDE